MIELWTAPPYGKETTRIRESRLEFQKLDKLIYEKIPSGFSIRNKAHR